MPSSYSVQILKRKRRFSTNINIFSDNKIHREFSDRATNASTIIPSIKNSAMSSLNNNNNNGKKFNQILKIMKKDKNKIKNKNKIEQPIISLKNMKINLLTYNDNNYPSTISN